MRKLFDFCFRLFFLGFLTESHVVTQAVLDCSVTQTEIIFAVVLKTKTNFVLVQMGFQLSC